MHIGREEPVGAQQTKSSALPQLPFGMQQAMLAPWLQLTGLKCPWPAPHWPTPLQVPPAEAQVPALWSAVPWSAVP